MVRTLLILLCAFAASSSASAMEARRPNVLFLLTDDHRPDAIGVLNPAVKTPAIDKLAAQGTLFTRAHIMGAMQGAVCVPSRAAILTGRTLFRCPEQPANVPTWPQTFAKDAGYRTHQVGKWHNGPAALAHSFQSSRDSFMGGMSDQKKIQLTEIANGKVNPKRTVERWSAEIFGDAAVDFLVKQSERTEQRDQPWLLWVAFTTPHDPRTSPEPYASMYDPAKVELPKNFMPTPPTETGVLGIRDEKLTPHPRTEAAVRKEIADYYGTLSHTDSQIGRILEALDKTGQRDNTIIVLAGDNGLALGSHGLLGKQNVYEHSVGVPLVMAGPQIGKGKRSDALVYLLDLFPTLGAFCGVKMPEGVEGKSFDRVVRATPEPGPRTDLFFAYAKLHRGVRDDRWKLIEWTVPGREKVTQLFDLQADPGEARDVAGANAEVLGRMKARLAEYQKELGDPLVK
ncbi:MAG TPA: sulfatase-like hydrolase/transferase [Tepidisphaeraceae bacterium]|nr:sulfatase-like hydrolase/transferase [Tepidisphaeraceae bacterium]